MHDLHCKNAKDMYDDVLKKRVQLLKETEKGVDNMCKEMDKIYSEGIEFGIEQGIEPGIEQGASQKAKEVALSLSGMGMSVDAIAKAVGVDSDTVKKWISAELCTI